VVAGVAAKAKRPLFVLSPHLSLTVIVRELEKNGLIQGKNLTVRRTIIDFDLENASLPKRLKVYFRIRNEASRMAKERPDLVLTMGTPATKYSRDTLIAAGVPLEFTAIAFPTAAGSRSLTEAGPGFTGVTTHMKMKDALTIIRQAFPSLKTIGIVHSDDANSIAHVEEIRKEGPFLGFTILTRQVSMKDRITPALQDLRKQGAEAFVVPPDPYYEIQAHERTGELIAFSRDSRVPVVSLVIDRIPGAVLYVGVDFETIGILTGQQAARILKDVARPESLPVLRQQELTIMVDTKLMQSFGIHLPPEILGRAISLE
jgi:putative ABC transport system substrate-binding protein